MGKSWKLNYYVQKKSKQRMEVFQEFSFWLWNMLEFKNYFTLIKFKTCLLFLGGTYKQ